MKLLTILLLDEAQTELLPVGKQVTVTDGTTALEGAVMASTSLVNQGPLTVSGDFHVEVGPVSPVSP